MMAIDGQDDFSRYGIAAATEFTVCIMSTRNDFSQVSGESPTDRALTLQTRASTPPSALAEASIQPFSAAGSPTSKPWPNALTPVPSIAFTAAVTSPALRAQIETFAPSAAKPSAIARPMPFVPPVTRAFLPLRNRSMHSSWESRAPAATGVPHRQN